MNDALGSNVPPHNKLRKIFSPKGHWVEYDLGENGQPIKQSKEGDQAPFGQLTKWFATHFEAVMWLKGYELQGRYLGEGYLDQVKAAYRTRQRIGEQE